MSAWPSVKGNNTYGVKINEDSTCLLGMGEINKDSAACREVHGECVSNPGPLRTKSGRNPVKNSNEGKAGVGLGRELLGGQSRPIGYNDRSKALTPCVDSGQDKRAGTRVMEWVT